MVIEKKSVDIETRVVSADGSYSRSIKADGSDRDIAISEVQKYEASAKGVIFGRLVEKGVLKRVLNPVPHYDENGKMIPWDKIDPELYVKKMALNALDSVIDSDSARSKYWIFTPASEEDIRDILALADMSRRSGLVLDNKYDKYMGIRATKVEAGKNYIFSQNDDCEFWSLYDIDGMLSQFKVMTEYFADTAKAQRDELKK